MLLAALALAAGAVIVFVACDSRGKGRVAPPAGFVGTSGARITIDGRPFRFVGANVAVVYGDDERARMPATLAEASRDGVRIIRVWAFGEVDDETLTGGARPKDKDWLYANPFRRGPDGWNEAAFVHLDRILAEAARHNLRVQICLTNWWPDTGGVTTYLRWAGITDAYDESQPYNVNVERAMLFYTNERARKMYRDHVERIVTRRNTVTGVLYRDDPTIMAYELMNEAQSPTGRWTERRAWVAEMSALIKSLDPHHLVTPGTWGYRNAWERRAWLEEHRLPTIDYCDVHVYPRDDHDSYVTSPEVLQEFVDNRAAAAFSLDKPLVFGEFGMTPEGFQGQGQVEWFRAYFEAATRAGAAGAMFWIWTHDAGRFYGLTYTTARDAGVRAEITRGAQLFDDTAGAAPPARLLDAGQHLVPRQFVFEREAGSDAARPVVSSTKNGNLLYRFAPESAARGRFEKLGGGAGYVWGEGVGFFEYDVPARAGWRWTKEIVVRAHLQPTPPFDARGRVQATRVTLFINGEDCGSRLVPIEQSPAASIQEWRINSLPLRLQAARGKPLSIRFTIKVDADLPSGITIANFPEGFDARGSAPIEVEVRD